MKEFRVRVCCYRQVNYIIKAKTLSAAKKRYAKGDYDESYEGGPMDGETINEEWYDE